MTITDKEKWLIYNEEHVPTLKVYCDGCKDFHSSDEITTRGYSASEEVREENGGQWTLGIESDFMGRDVVTFECKTDEKVHKGIVVSS
jgi:hypothetical protein